MNVTCGAKEILPGALLVFRKIEMVLLISLATTMSGLPSPSMSPMTTPTGPVPTEKVS